jgi:hypothetical protein
MRYLEDGDLPIDNNWVESRIRPVALGRANWLFPGSLRVGKRAAVVMSLIQSAKPNDHDPYRYLSNVLERLPTQPASRVADSRRITGGLFKSPLRLRESPGTTEIKVGSADGYG